MTFINSFKARFVTLAAVLLFACATAGAQIDSTGTPGRIAKFNTTNSVGNSVMFEDKEGRIGLGTSLPSSRLTVLGVIESLGGGFKFPDGTVQTTAGVAANQVVTSLNGLTGPVAIAAGPNITITPNGNTLTVASSVKDPALSAFQVELVLDYEVGDFTASTSLTVPSNKRLVIEYVTIRGTTDGAFSICNLRTRLNGSQVAHAIIPLKVEGTDRVFTAQSQVRIYADSGTSVQFGANRTGTQTDGRIELSISGYLVDMP